jgi:hypothetical protein
LIAAAGRSADSAAQAAAQHVTDQLLMPDARKKENWCGHTPAAWSGQCRLTDAGHFMRHLGTAIPC